MIKFERIFELHKILDARRLPTSTKELAEELECSQRTLQRDIAFLGDRLRAPVESTPDGYYYDKDKHGHYELPGLWFTDTELLALLVAQHFLADIGQSELLGEHIQPLTKRIQQLLGGKHGGSSEILHRVRLLPQASRTVTTHEFQKTATALLKRKKLRINYYSRSTDEHSERTVSPQRLVRYRDNWYLDAWCHLREDLRSFSLDNLQPLQIQDQVARKVSDKALDALLADGYGIFSGKADKQVKLRFSAWAARWIKDEKWHPKQHIEIQTDGNLILSLPYSRHPELVMDILKWGGEVRVLEPLELAEEVKKRLKKALSQY